MDPIAAFRKQQERNQCGASSQNTVAQVRGAMVFDSLGKGSNGLVQIEEVTRGFKTTLGDGADAPVRQIKKVFSKVDREGKAGLNIKQFCELVHEVSSYMMGHPNWAREEAEEEKQALQLEMEQKAREVPDIFALLGITKSLELQALEDRKRQALISNEAARQGRLARLSCAGTSIIAARRFAVGLKHSHASKMSNRSTASSRLEVDPEPFSPSKKLHGAWERFSWSSVSESASQVLLNSRQIHLPDGLPQIQSMGRRHGGCMQLRFSRDGTQVAGGFFDGGVRVFNVAKAAQVHCLNLPASLGGTMKGTYDAEVSITHQVNLAYYIAKKWEPVTNLCWQSRASKQNMLASVDTKGSLKLWNIPRCMDTRPPQCLGEVSTGSPLTAAAFTCNGTALAVGGDEQVVKVYDIQEAFGKTDLLKAKQLGHGVSYGDKLGAHSMKIMSLCTHPRQPAIIVSAGLDAQILLWDTRASSTIPVLGMHGLELAGDAIDISKDGLTLLAGSHRWKNPIEIYDLRMTTDRKPVTSYEWRANELLSEGAGKCTTCQLFSAGWDELENKIIVAAGEIENLARVFERPTDPEEPLRIIGTLRGEGIAFWSSAVSADARKVAFGSADGSVCIADVSMQQVQSAR